MLDNKTEPTILLVEDEMPLLRAVQAKLRGSGFEAVSARTVDQALWNDLPT
jgi:DNA-binding response OmpR family regulator